MPIGSPTPFEVLTNFGTLGTNKEQPRLLFPARFAGQPGAWPRIRINVGNSAKGLGPIPAASKGDHYAIRGFSDVRPVGH